ncbi:LacI family transcriptional regulator [Chitinivorax tropicus]|uniref:LacI family transcriptional regulator n=1 Tax=Chitinivorax tropicus TaxID=714531 RepID=A0A840MUY8_9PROT|nr:LacI family DNA-binding transcriptional regulator [Chitinivorax tropicus]MBB5018991.1 LacI family transcriptional regulator [Chitinivorax tropicus]
MSEIQSPAAPPPTLEDVAALAGVSTSTVSRFLSGAVPVSEPRSKRIQAAIDALQFTPNLLAQSLKKGRAMTIGVIAHNMTSQYFSTILTHIEHALGEAGYALLIVTGHWSETIEAQRIALLTARRVDGIILLEGRLPDEQILHHARKTPIVVTGRQLVGEQVYGFKLDHRAGALLAVEHLLQQGHRRIAYIDGPPGHGDATARLSGYQQALAQYGVPFDPDLVACGNFQQADGHAATTRLLSQGRAFTALFAANDESAFGARLALFEQGFRVPDDISVVGFDDIPGAAFTTPPLTTVRQPLAEIGAAAANAMLGLLSKRPIAIDIPPFGLQVRRSTKLCLAS